MAGKRKQVWRWFLISVMAGAFFMAAGNPVTDTASASDKIRQKMTAVNNQTAPAGEKGEAPDKVKKVKTADSGEYIRIRWEPCKGAEGYIIEKREGSGAFQSRAISSRKDDCAYTDYDVEPGRTYQYRVRSYRNGNGSCYTAESTETETIQAALAVPVITDIRCNRADTRAWISWKKIENADRYLIRVKIGQRILYKEAADRTVCRIPIEKGEKISVQIRASAVVGGKRIYSGCEKNAVTLYPDRYEKQKILFEGDSITYGRTWKGRSQVPAPARVGQLLGCQVVNRAVPGSVAGNPTDRELPDLYQRLLDGKTDYRNYDVICIGIGTNDYRFQIPVGSPGDTQKDGTFYGYLNTCLDKIREQNPDGAIVLETPIYRTRVGESDRNVGFHTPNRLGYTLEDYQNAIIRAAENRDNLYIYHSQEQGIINEQNGDRLLYDGLHPCDEGYGAIGNSLAEFLRNEVLKEKDGNL